MADKNTTDKEALKAAKEAEKAAEKAKKERIKQSKPKKEGSVFSRAGGAVKKFWKDFVGTVKKVVWPPANQVLKSSVVVLITILVIGLVVFGIDRGLQALYKVGSEAVVELGEKNKAEEETTAAESVEAALEEAASNAVEGATEAEAETPAAEEETSAEEASAEAETTEASEAETAVSEEATTAA